MIQRRLPVRVEEPHLVAVLDPTVGIHAAIVCLIAVAVERHWPDFKGKLQLNGLNLPPGFGFATTELPAGKKEVRVKLTVAANVPPGRYSVVLRGDAQVPFSKDPAAAARPNVRVADPSTPLTVNVTAPPKK